MEWILAAVFLMVVGLLFAPRERGLVDEAHVYITESFRHLHASPLPEWAKGMTLYEVFPRVYPPSGKLSDIRRDLPRLQRLGVRCLWLMPIHPTGRKGRKGTYGSPYAVQDYFAIDPDIGDETELRQLVSEVHAADMRILLDMVVNHAANDHVEMPRHPEWFVRDRDGGFTRRVASWSDVTDWDHRNPAALEYLREALLYWVREFDVDGYRCDVAGLVPLAFWEQVREDLQRLKTDLFMLAEGDDPRMHLKAFDATYDWDLFYKMIDVRTGRAAAAELARLLQKEEGLYPEGSVLLRFVENHDLPRATQSFGIRGFRPYAALVFAASGIPLIYNGQEAGLRRSPSLFEKEILDLEGGNARMQRFYRHLVRLRQRHPVFFDGYTIAVETDQPRRAAAIVRSSDAQTAAVVVNCTSRPLEIRPSWPVETSRHISWRVMATRDYPEPTALPDRLRLPSFGFWIAVSSE